MVAKRKISFSESNLCSVIEACLAENPLAQKVLIKQFLGFAKSVCLRFSANSRETEEMLNDGFLKIFSSLDRYNSTMPFKPWLRTIMVNTAIDYYRKNSKHPLTTDIGELEIADFNDDIISHISAEEILGFVQKLSPACRLVFTLYVVEGYNHREIAEKLGIREGTSKSNLQDARRKLQGMIKKEYPQLYLAYTAKALSVDEN